MDKVNSLEEKIQKLKEKRKHIQMGHAAPLAAPKNLKRLNQQITKSEEQRYRRMHKLQITSPIAKKKNKDLNRSWFSS